METYHLKSKIKIAAVIPTVNLDSKPLSERKVLNQVLFILSIFHILIKKKFLGEKRKGRNVH